MTAISRLGVKGFKSLREIELPLTGVNVVIGSNGSGKSNLISTFRLLASIMDENLQTHIGISGGANSILFDGAARTPQIELDVELTGKIGYYCKLVYAAPDTLIFGEERFRRDKVSPWNTLGKGHRETRVREPNLRTDVTAALQQTLGLTRWYHLHNTSDTARIRTKWDEFDCAYLRADGANLGPFLVNLARLAPPYYRRIVDTIRLAAPYLLDFVLEPQEGRILLQWREKESDVVFGAHQASDGTLRFFVLMALLLQPEDSLPDVLIIDEPELGLHPSALDIVAGAIRAASLHCQVILCTQSPALVDYFEPQDVIVVDRHGRESKFRRLDPSDLSEWIEAYSIGELWEKNVIGGKP